MNKLNGQYVQDRAKELLDGLDDEINGFVLAIDTDDNTGVAIVGTGGTVATLVEAVIRGQVDEAQDFIGKHVCADYIARIERIKASLLSDDEEVEEDAS